MLKNILDHDEKAVTIEIIQKFVADYYNLKLVELKSRNNSKSVAMPRQIAMYLCKSLTHASLPEIGRSFGGKHHSTVIHSIRKVEDLRKKRPGFQQPDRAIFWKGFAETSGFPQLGSEHCCGKPVDVTAGLESRSRNGSMQRTFFPQTKLLIVKD